jgi:thymidylate synthase
MGINKADDECKRVINHIIDHGGWDVDPRPRWEDGTPAHTISVNGVMSQFDLSKGEFPLLTLRPVAVKSAIGELLWIYQDQSNDLNLLRDKYGITWWDPWDIGDRTIGARYGETVRRHKIMDYLLNSLKTHPDSRYHIINLWQYDDFYATEGLKPCCFQMNFNVRHGRDDGINYLDGTLYQRSCDYLTAGCTINQAQYAIFLCIIAHCFNYTPGLFTWFGQNVQIYDRHMENAKIMLKRYSVDGINPRIIIDTKETDFYKISKDDIIIEGYDRKKIASINPQLKFELAI